MDINSIDWEPSADDPSSRYWVRKQFGSLYLYKAQKPDLETALGPYYAIINWNLANEVRISNVNVLMAQALIYEYGGERYYGK
jgi:hypothetical protein